MRRRTETTIILAAALVGLAIPVLLSIYLAWKFAVDAETEHAMTYALDALARSDAVSDQIDSAFRKLAASAKGVPCSASGQALMKKLDVSSSYIQAVGYVAGNRVACSSLGTALDGLDLGPPDMVRSSGVRLRIDVELPFAPDARFLVVERAGYIAVIHKDLPIDVTTTVPGIVLATVATPELRLLAARGTVLPAWLALTRDGPRVTMVDRSHVVAVARSSRYLLTTICAIPASELNAKVNYLLLALIPTGLLAGAVITTAIFHLAKQQTAMPAMIRTAIRRGEFYLEYQPVIDLRTGRTAGAEALIRWRRMTNEVIRPDIFIPIAEDTGQIRRISRCVAELLARDARDFFVRYPDHHLGLNLSAADLHDADTLFMLREIASATGARKGSLIVEATERSFTDHALAADVIAGLRAEGFPVAIDDFGTGYSSLAYLQRIRLDYLKIDKSFVEAIDTEAPTSGVTQHIIGMARELQLEMIAEGVETQAQADFLKERGVQYAQGWLYARPMPFKQFLERLEREAGA